MLPLLQHSSMKDRSYSICLRVEHCVQWVRHHTQLCAKVVAVPSEQGLVGGCGDAVLHQCANVVYKPAYRGEVKHLGWNVCGDPHCASLCKQADDLDSSTFQGRYIVSRHLGRSNQNFEPKKTQSNPLQHE